MNKGIAVPYIIALILGVAVVALIGYWLIALGARLPWVSTQSYCEGRQAAWCTEWATTGQDPGTGKDWTTFAKDCPVDDYPQPDEAFCGITS